MNLLSKQPSRKQLILCWALALLSIGGLGGVHVYTNAEYVFASAIIIPVFFVAWAGGLSHGIAASLFGALLWIASDLIVLHESHADWRTWINGITRFLTYGFVAYLTAHIRDLLQREIRLSTHDALTGLYNRRAFFDQGQTEVERASRYEHSLAVIFLDLDDFKQINDRHGHESGDRALEKVAVALIGSLRSTDYIARLGGDEFAILLPEIDEQAARQTGEKTLHAVESALLSYPPASASIGIAWFERPLDQFPAMLQAADALMYEVKHDHKSGLRMRSFAAKTNSSDPASESLLEHSSNS